MTTPQRPIHARFAGSEEESLAELLTTELPRLRSYDTVSGYFTPTVFGLLDLPLRSLPAGIKIRLLCGSLMSEEASALARRLKEAGRNAVETAIEVWRAEAEQRDFSPLELEGLGLLASLLHSGQLEVRVWNGERFLHAKTGLGRRLDGTLFLHTGSPNLTYSGASRNHEAMAILDELGAGPETGAAKDRAGQPVVYSSDPFADHQVWFERFWNDASAVPLEEAEVELIRTVRRKRKRRPVDVSTFEQAEPEEQVDAATEGSPSPIELFDHQRAFITRFVREHRDGGCRVVLADEVGLGKTIEIALSVVIASILSRKPSVIFAPSAVVEQWQEEIEERLGVRAAYWRSQQWHGGRWNNWAPYPSPTKPAGATRTYDLDDCPTTIGIISTGLLTGNDGGSGNWQKLKERGRYAALALDEGHKARRGGSGLGSRPWANVDDHRRTKKGAAGYNKLWNAVRDLRDSAESLIVATATPVQLGKIEAYDLLVLLERSDADRTILGGQGALWRDEPDRTVDLANDEARCGSLAGHDVLELSLRPARNRMRPLAVRALQAATAIDPSSWLADQLTAAGGDVGRLMAQMDPAQLEQDTAALRLALPFNTPYHHRIVRRSRAKLEEAGRLRKVGVAHADPEPIEMDPRHAEAADLAVELLASLQRRGALPNSAFMRTHLLRRVTSSPEAGRISAINLKNSAAIGGAVSDDDALREEEEEGFRPKSGDKKEKLAPDEIGIVDRIADLLGSGDIIDRKLDRLHRLLEHGPDRVEDADAPFLLRPWREVGCLIFSQYKDTADYVARDLAIRFPGMPIGLYAGSKPGIYLVDPELNDGPKLRGMSRSKIQEEVQQGNLKILVGSDAAAEGLNLQQLSTMVNYDLPYNPTRLEQRKGRIQRIGQDFLAIGIANLRYAGTVEDRVHELIRERLGQSYEMLVHVSDVIEQSWERLSYSASGDSLDDRLSAVGAELSDKKNAPERRPFEVDESDDLDLPSGSASVEQLLLDYGQKQAVLRAGWRDVATADLPPVGSVVPDPGSTSQQASIQTQGDGTPPAYGDTLRVIKSVAKSPSGKPGRDIALDLLRSGSFAFMRSEQFGHQYQAGSRILLYEPGVGVFAWFELAGSIEDVATPMDADLSDRFPRSAPVAAWGEISPPVVFTPEVVPTIDRLRGHGDRWGWLVRTPNRLGEADFVRLGGPADSQTLKAV
jgi:superfamily II DNA or RNA helicase